MVINNTSEYIVALQEVIQLMSVDPAIDSEDGARLIELADAAILYEQTYIYRSQQ